MFRIMRLATLRAEYPYSSFNRVDWLGYAVSLWSHAWNSTKRRLNIKKVYFVLIFRFFIFCVWAILSPNFHISEYLNFRFRSIKWGTSYKFLTSNHLTKDFKRGFLINIYRIKLKIQYHIDFFCQKKVASCLWFSFLCKMVYKLWSQIDINYF